EKTAGSTQPMIGKTVIDYGCGSGVLAIACLLLGAEHAWAVDIDEQALQASQENARINGVQDRLSIGLPESVRAQSADLVMANILFKPLMDLADALALCVKPSGELIVSGILESQSSPLRMRYNGDFEFSGTQTMDGWVMLSASRRLV
ncbi:MAG: 50S ribosomal protein L11 methyltransferase, partial [Granulosicoccus sp.]